MTSAALDFQGADRARPLPLATIAGFAAVIIAWELLARTVLAGSYVLAPPSAIVARIVEDRALYGRALWVTLREAALGFVFGNLAAVLLASLVSILPRTERVVQGIALIVFCLPLVATGPILRVLFGPGEGPQITLAALGVYYTTFIPLVVGLRAVPAGWLDLIASYGRGRFSAFVRVRARASVPYLVAGLQIAAPAAFLGAMVGEFTGAEQGMGVLSIQTMRSLDVDGTWALAAIATAVAVAGYLAVGAAGRLLAPGAPPLLLAVARADTSDARRRRLSALGVFVLTTAIVLLLWQGTMDIFGLNRFFAKRPLDIVAYLVTGPEAADHRAILFSALGQTLAVTLPGYLAGLALGAIVAAVFQLLPLVARVATPIAIALRSIPIVATAPLIVLAFGRGLAGMLVIVAVMNFFPTFVACAQGLRQTPGQVVDFFSVFDAGRLRMLFLARIPVMLPAFFAAARMAVPSAVLAATVAEWLATGTGIGNLMALTASTSNYNMLWSSVVVLTLTSVAGYLIVGVAERRALARFAPEQVA